ncbi:RagB/SusD family nutrient uptake outer membrane protein [Phnomibacter ginsenosidimutans]|nr:RagB/SusD family nutrient uptake outer membrane protein [Phnomibacter ginsenosidimutans]
MQQHKILILLLVGGLLTGCEKFLDERPDKTATVPVTVQDAQALLDNVTIVNSNWMWATHLYSDDVQVSSSAYAAVTNEAARQNYVWGDAADNAAQWMACYRRVYQANTVLAMIDRMPVADTAQMAVRDVRGQALFLRALSYYRLAQLFAVPYQTGMADNGFGLPLVLTEDIGAGYVRSSIASTYEQMVKDVTAAVWLLPERARFLTRASKPAAWALLARVALQMGDMVLAAKASAAGLEMQGSLLDYATLNASATVPFQRFNTEVLYHSTMSAGISNNVSRVDTGLYKLYAADDLRKGLYWQRQPDGLYNFKGNYDGQVSGVYFDGLTTGELYLIRAESALALGDRAGALGALNQLLEKRWKRSSWVPLDIQDPGQLAERIRLERRLELAYRGLRWPDIRRYWQTGVWKEGLRRQLDNNEYVLKPDSKRVTALLPMVVVAMGGVVQNER